MTLAALVLVLKGAESVRLKVLIDGSRGLEAIGAVQRVQGMFSIPLPDTRHECPHTQVESLPISGTKPTRVFEFVLPAPQDAEEDQVVYLQDPIAEMVVFAATDINGCRWLGASGRAFAFAQRSIVNPFPNVVLPDTLPPGTKVQVLIQDVKTIRPWVHVTDVPTFRRISTTIWMGLAAFSAMLLAAAFIATGFTGLMRQTVVWSFVVYVVCFLFWLSQNFNMVAAGIGYWPEGPYFPFMQAMAVASVVVGIGMASVEFMQLEAWRRRLFQVGILVCAAFFVSSVWFPYGYKTGAAILGLVALAIAWTLLRKLRTADLPLKLFSLGLTATMTGGLVQALSVISEGGPSGYWSVIAFPLGAFFQGILWMVSLVARSDQNRRAQEAQLLHDATFDALTGVHNRKAFTDRLATRLAQYQADGAGACTLIFLGLDRFKLINDSMGHKAGDDLLCQTAARLQSAAICADGLARFGSDEFLLVSDRCTTEAEALDLAHRIQRELAPAWQVEGRELMVTASMGVLLVNPRYSQVADVLRDVDTALHRAKQSGRNQFALFDATMREQVEHQFRIETDLVHAIELHQLELHFQPIVRLTDGAHAGFEALVRWRHPVHGLMSPCQFIPIAEDSGHIRALGTRVIELTMSAIAGWKAAGVWLAGWYVSINVSGDQLFDTSLVTTLQRLQQQNQVAGEDIRLELTETAVIANLDIANQIFPLLSERGVMLCMDDFGTGYSSLSYLSKLPFQVLKIDKSFIDGLLDQPQQRALVKAMLSLARELTMQVVAEGIETPEQADALLSFGCDYGQGYHFARPMPLDDATMWLRNRAQASA